MKRHPLSTTVKAATCAMVLAAAAPPAWAQAERDALVQVEKYCTASWRNARIEIQEWNDCTQQTVADLLTRIPRERLGVAIGEPESTERRELTRSIWCTVQRMRRAKRHLPLEPGLDPAAADPMIARDRSQALQDAIVSDEANLSSRQQQILRHLLDGSTVAEIASDLEIPAARVSDEKYKAIKKLRAVMV